MATINNVVRYCIIDNEAVTRLQLRATIYKLRPNYSCVGEADDLLGLSQCLAKCPNLLIVNSQLSDGTVYTVLKHDENRIPVIITSDYVECEEETQGLNKVAFSQKPVSQKEIEEMLCKFETMAWKR